MATTVLIVFSLTLLLRATFSLPISLDVTVQSSESVQDIVLTERTSVLDREAILKPGADTELVLSLSSETLVGVFPSLNAGNVKGNSVGTEHVRRRRDIVRNKIKCPGDMKAFAGRCLTREEYDDVIKDYEAE